MSRKNSEPTPAKARKILRDGKVHGRRLTPAQKRFFGHIVGKGNKG